MPERKLAVDELDAVAWCENPRRRHPVVLVYVESPFRNRDRGRHSRPLSMVATSYPSPAPLRAFQELTAADFSLSPTHPARAASRPRRSAPNHSLGVPDHGLVFRLALSKGLLRRLPVGNLSPESILHQHQLRGAPVELSLEFRDAPLLRLNPGPIILRSAHQPSPFCLSRHRSIPAQAGSTHPLSVVERLLI